MDMLNPEMFGDIDPESSQYDEDCQTLLRMDTNEIFPGNGINVDYMLNDLMENPADVNGAYVKVEGYRPIPLVYGADGRTVPGHFKNIPSLDEMDHSSHNFGVEVYGKPCSASSWCYSKELKKLYVKKKTPVTVNVSCAPCESNLKLRVMLVCSSSQDVYKTISRCQDHMRKDGAKDHMVKDHIVRCLNPVASYIGRHDGVNFEDRLAMMIDLNSTGNHQVKLNVPISLEFLCQNSCPTIERRATSLLFTLEDERGTLLGRKSISVKICSCPKRDMDKDEKKVQGDGDAGKNKRKHVNAPANEPPQKMSRQSSGLAKATVIGNVSYQKNLPTPSSSMVSCIKKESPFTPLGRSLSTLSCSSIDDDSSGVEITLKLPDFETALAVTKYAFQYVSSTFITLQDPVEQRRMAKYLSKTSRLSQKLKESDHRQSCDASQTGHTNHDTMQSNNDILE